jgi:hypothetical protein
MNANANEVQNTTTAPAGAVPPLAAQVPPAPAEETPTVDIKSAWYAEAAMTEANKELERIVPLAESAGIPMFSNWDAEGEEMPENRNLAIIPVAPKRGAEPNGIAISAQPTLDALLAHGEEGVKFVHETIAKALMGRTRSALRAMIKAGNSAVASLPVTIADFITVQSRDQGLGAFREISKPYITHLQTKGFSMLDQKQLRAIFMSAQYAATSYPNTPATSWSGLLDRCIAAATAKNLDPGAMLAWRDTRDAFSVSAGGDFDVDEIEAMIARDDADDDDDDADETDAAA